MNIVLLLLLWREGGKHGHGSSTATVEGDNCEHITSTIPMEGG